ncbi:MAG: hypothetical protein V2J65_23015, partial [Desulfobacteraceae bacterium]|nr:hypothetical protein [Desulfobacteraceae bacterium]
MKTIINSLIRSINKLPEGKYPPEYFTPAVVRSYLFVSYGYPVGFIMHLSFIGVFFFIGVEELALFNFISVSLWGIAILLNGKGYFWQGYLLVAFELISHAAICTVIIGWSNGFQYYLLQMPVAIFLVHWRTSTKILVAFVFTFAFMAINHYATVSTPYVVINPLYTAALNYGNILSTCFGMAVMGYIYYTATRNIEEKLKIEHKRTNEALMERNKLLDRLNLELADAAEYVRNILP